MIIALILYAAWKVIKKRLSSPEMKHRFNKFLAQYLSEGAVKQLKGEEGGESGSKKKKVRILETTSFAVLPNKQIAGGVKSCLKKTSSIGGIEKEKVLKD
eukprot:CAMPEP_0202972220 /NCGR_PEP_ID=MMETSP1396-20130829/34557_1 /ASSEMBLY_ACC=CAM_ASM_000872 /TAXON_ID= /ORGANISM="Pseudokeronopsis sp., Strain Brazil" /LENGTH=99 /DNA_ID=CAMNT_0049702405 /DNA_START=114 /DNA_END=413 /DNA_ORIENTATION=-